MQDKTNILRRKQKQQGIALIIVLASVVLLTILVLAFLTGVGSELQSSKMYANGSSVKLLAQSAVSLVMGEIQAATAGQANTKTGIQTLCWASQPGMIRNYDLTGTPYSFYKLYSDDTMYSDVNLATGGKFDHTAIGNQVPSNWYSQKGVYVDLNQPVYVNNVSYFPILDGSKADYSTSYSNPLANLVTPTPASSSINSLIPLTNGLPAVTGFWLNGNTPVDPTSPNVAPMPVKWLYVLKNGEVIVPDSNPVAGTVTFNTATPNGVQQVRPSTSDPIVGRMAYWTDDETCKVNINTASEGTFWDTPRSYSGSDYPYATSQPVQNEFQRYPGHPSTVSLSAVFNGLTGESGTVFPENLYQVTPRVIPGGSKEGTVTVSPTAGALTMKSTRLYTSPDELLFQTSIAPGTPGSGKRALNNALLATATDLDQMAIEKAKFFITTSSVAPDVNLFNLPRVSMWPITLTGAGASALTPATTAFDKLIAFCSTLAGNKYYFQRWDPASSLNDLPSTGLAVNPSNPLSRNRDLLEYLRTLTSQTIPGFGGDFKTKYSSDRDQILTEMFDYIRSTNLQDSSAGATGYAKNMDPSGTAGTDPYLNGGLGQVVPIVDTTISITDSVKDSVQGNLSNNPRGFGRFPTVQEAALVFIGAGDSSTVASSATPAAQATNPNPPTSYTPPVLAGSQRVQAGFFLQMFDPSEGLAITRPWYQIKVSHLENLQWNSKPIFPTNAAFPFVYYTNGVITKALAVDINGNALLGATGLANGYVGFSYGGQIDFRQQSQLRDSATGGNATTVGHWKLPIYPFISPPTGQPAPLSTAADMLTNGTFNFSTTGDVTVQIYSLDSSGVASTNPIQTVYLNFPPGAFPVPTSIDNNPSPPAATNPIVSFLPSTTTAAQITNYNFLSFLDTYGGPAAGTMGSAYGRLGFPAYISWLSSRDVVRAVVATPGDMRLIAARQNVPDVFYKPITNSNPASPQFPTSADYLGGVLAPFSHSLRLLTGLPLYGSIGGRLIYSSTGAYDAYQTQYFKNPPVTGPDIGNSTYSFGGGTGLRPKDNDVPNQTASVLMGGSGSVPGDWDNGFGNSRDGAFINKADEGDAGTPSASPGPFALNGFPYFELDYNNALPGATFFSPNRMIPSPGMFGSLPSGVWSNKPWQTLLFRPGPSGHVGLTSPPDHLLLDLFNMPVVEPYAISSPLATAGRINMNYLMVPFTYINRDTGLRAVMKKQMVTAIPNTAIGGGLALYKTHLNTANGYSGSLPTTRYPINLDLTLSQFLGRFYATAGSQGSTGTPDIFHSPTELCSLDLVPTDPTAATSSLLTLPISRSNMDAYWTKNSITGDNTRERPYTNIYPLLTTKSNTFTVHYRVQTLKPVPGGNAAQWREGTDVVNAEYRGSQTIERYVDPNAISNTAGVPFPDYANPNTVGASVTFPPTTPISQFYKFRIVSTKQFPP